MREPAESYSDDEAERRMNDAVRQALNTPPQPKSAEKAPIVTTPQSPSDTRKPNT